MKKFFTQNLCNDSNKKERKVVAPSVESLNFLKSFARVYHVDQSLPAPLSGVCVN